MELGLFSLWSITDICPLLPGVSCVLGAVLVECARLCDLCVSTISIPTLA